MVSVDVLCPGGRRQSVTLSAECTLQEVLELVCARQNLGSDCHELQYRGRRLDLCSSLRASTVLNKAQLELVQTEAVCHTSSVTVAVQLVSGERRQTVVPCSTSLWHVLQQVEASRGPETEACDRLVCVFAGRQVKGMEALKETTLLRLGVTGGRVLVRFSVEKSTHSPVHVTTPLVGKKVRSPDRSGVGCSNTDAGQLTCVSTECAASQCKSRDETIRKSVETGRTVEVETASLPTRADSPTKVDAALEQSSMKFENVGEQMEVEPSVNLETSPKQLENESMKNDEAYCISSGQPISSVAPAVSATAECSASESAVSETTVPQVGSDCSSSTEYALTDDNVVVFSLEDVPAATEEPDEFFEVTEDDVRRRYRELCERNAVLNDAPLITDHQRQAQLEADRLTLLAGSSKCAVRVHFPDGLILQLLVPSTATGDAVFRSVARHIQQPQIPFRLLMPGQQSRFLQRDQLLIEADCLPSVRLVIEATERHFPPPSLSDAARQKITSLSVANSLVSSTKRRSKVHTTSAAQRPSSTTSKASHTPKWFLMNKSNR